MIYGNLPQWAMDPNYRNPNFWLVTGCQEVAGCPVQPSIEDSRCDAHVGGNGEGSGDDHRHRFQLFRDLFLVRALGNYLWQSVRASSEASPTPYEQHYDPLTRLVELTYGS